MSKKIVLHFLQTAILITFFTIGFIFSIKTPLLRGRDELAHFRFIRFIVENDHLPVTWDERKEAGYKAEWPPLFHLIIGMIGQGIDINSPPFVNTRLTENNPRVQLVFGPDDIRFAKTLATEDPYQGELLLWYVGRWGTLLTGTIGLIIIYVLIRVEQTNRDWLALSAVASLAFTLSYVRDSSVISYDPLLSIPINLYLLLIFFTLKKPEVNWHYFGLGLLMGLAGLIKYTPLSAALVIPGLIIWFAYQYQWKTPLIVWRITLFGLGLLLTFGVWILYMWIYFNRVAELGWISGSLYPFLADNLAVGDQTSRWFASLVTGEKLTGTRILRGDASFFAWVFALLINIFGNQWLAWGFLFLFGVALVGVFRQWFGASQYKRLWVVLLLAHFALFLFFPVLRFLSVGEINTNTVAGQHVVFPTGAVVILLLFIGLNRWLTTSRSILLFAVTAGLCLLQTLLFGSRIQTTPAIPLPIQSVPLSKNEQVLAKFGDISLIGYEYAPDENSLKTTLFWRAENFLTEDYSVELSLLDTQRQIQVRREGQPLNGYYPTRAWIKGDRVRDTISLPLMGLQSGNYHLQLRVLNNAKQPVDNNVFYLSVIKLATPVPMMATNTLSLADTVIGYDLWPQDTPIENPPFYQERATITLVTSPRLPDDVQVKLASSNQQVYKPTDHTQNMYNFTVEPYFVSGPYHFRFEKWLNNEIIDQEETIDLLQIKTSKRQFEIGSLEHPIQANFAGQVTLLGYNLPQRKIKAGHQLPITLHWQALKEIGADLLTFNRIIDKNQQVFGEMDRRVRDIYSTLLWAPNEIVSDSFEMQINPDAPDGIYYFLVGLYLPVGESAVSLPLVQDGKFTDVSDVRIGPIKIGQTPSGLTIKNPKPKHIVEYYLGDKVNLKLIGYDLNQFTLTLYWQLLSPLTIDYTTFVHIRNEAGEMVAQKDQPPLAGAYPTGLWDVGETVADEIIIPLPNDLPSGKYRVVVGMYDFETGQRLNIPDNPSDEIELTIIQIP